MKNFRVLYLLTLLFLVFSLSACPAVGPASPKFDSSKKVRDVSFLLDGLRERSKELRSYRSLAKASLMFGEQENRLRYAIAKRGLNYFRLEALPMNTVYTLSLLQLSGDKVLFLDSVDKLARRSKAGGKALNSMLQLPLTERELMAYINARLPLDVLDALADGELSVYEVDGLVLENSLKNSDERRTSYLITDRLESRFWEIDSESFLLLRFHAREMPRDLALIDLRLNSFYSVSGVQLPKKLQASIPSKEVQIDLDFVIQKVNLELPDSLFKLQIPPGYSLK